jgi:hypothetical protein
MSRRERLQRQAQMEADWQEQQRERPGEPARGVPLAEQCPARFGGPHDYSMKGNDGNTRCWYCAKRREA